MLVRCKNCGILWERVTEWDNPGGTVLDTDICKVCPKCSSNAWEREKEMRP